MSPKVSIIIPVYNVEKYLNQCLDSVINQTLKDIEIICIDDGSKDKSGQILNDYAKKDTRIKVIHKQNSGYGISMNIGLENAKGEYIGIVESDDFIEPNMYEILYDTATKNNLDLVRCQYYLYSSKNNTNILMDSSCVLKNSVYCPMDNTLPFIQAPAIWTNLIKRNLIVDNKISFLETPGASYQDTSFAFKLYACAKRFMMISDVLLHYRIDNENSSVNSLGKANCVITEYEEIKRFAIEKGFYEKMKNLIFRIKYSCYRWNYKRLNSKLKYDFLLKMSKEVRIDFLQGNIDRQLFSFKEYIKILFLVFLSSVYKFLDRGC